MKKVICRFISLALILAAVCPAAIAAEEDGEQLVLWEDWGYESLEEFLADFEMTEEEYYEFEEEERQYAREQAEYEERLRAESEEEIKRLGGVSGAVNVMYNGKFISVADPEKSDVSGIWDVYVPARSLLEAMGAKVSFDTKESAIVAEFTDKTARIFIGQETITVTENGDRYSLTIEAPYIRDGVSYIQVRSVGQALGLDVVWDYTYSVAVIIDTEKIAAEADKSFTILNRMFGVHMINTAPAEGTYKTTLNLLAAVTMFNSLDGDAKADIKAGSSIHTDGRNFAIKGNMDISALIDMLLELELVKDIMTGDELEEVLGIIDALRKAEIELIFNRSEDKLYIKAPALSAFVTGFPANDWAVVSGLGAYVDELGEMIASNTVGDMLGETSVGALIVSSQGYSYSGQIYRYEEIMNSLELCMALFGDEQFKKNGGDYTLSKTLGDLRAAEKKFGQSLDVSEFNVKLTLKTSGDAVTGLVGDFLLRGVSDGYSPEMRGSGKFDIGLEKAKYSVDIHVKNTVRVLAEIDSGMKATSEPVPKAPPAGEKIVDLDTILGDYIPGTGIGLLFAAS